jgi:hypothetical protein
VLGETLDLARPVALSLLAVLHFLPHSAEPAAVLIRRLVEALAAGSYLVIRWRPGPVHRRRRPPVRADRQETLPRGRQITR